MQAAAQAKNTARALINETRARRLEAGHGFWCFFRMAQSARRRAAAAPAIPETSTPIAPSVPAGTQQELFA